MTFLNSSRKTLLNWFLKSKNIAARFWKPTGFLGVVNIFLNGKLHGFHHKVRTVWNANSIIVGKEVVGKFLSKCAFNVAGNDTSDRSRNSKGS
jgi:hypothetical protein